MSVFSTTLQIESYIAQPYWPELSDVIEIQKRSGMNLVRSHDKREARLRSHLEAIEMKYEDYSDLVRLSQRRWYRVDNDDSESEIVIPNHQFSGMLVQAVKSAPAGSRIPVDDLRNRLRASDFLTGKTKADRLYRRYVKGDQSNQRRLQEDEVIENFEAKGTLEFDESELKLKSVHALLQHGLKQIGVGSARKMGFGRGKLVDIKQR